MGLLAKKGMLFVLIFFGWSGIGRADGNFFRLTMLDYFGAGAAAADDDSGVYQPPRAVQELLASPTEASALAYLRWQHDRLQKIVRAQEILEKVMADHGDMYQIQ